MESFRNNPDTCHIYIALSDKSEPYVINTKASERQLFDKNDANIIAYGEYLSHETTSSYQQIEIPLVRPTARRNTLLSSALPASGAIIMWAVSAVRFGLTKWN